MELLENECYLTSDILEQMSKGTFPINANFFFNPCKTEIESSDDEIPSSWTNLSDILIEVSSYVRSSIPGWFSVERSNHMKKKARIVEGSRTRVEGDEAELLLKSGELILCIVGLYHLLKGWKGPISPINFSDVRLILPA